MKFISASICCGAQKLSYSVVMVFVFHIIHQISSNIKYSHRMVFKQVNIICIIEQYIHSIVGDNKQRFHGNLMVSECNECKRGCWEGAAREAHVNHQLITNIVIYRLVSPQSAWYVGRAPAQVAGSASFPEASRRPLSSTRATHTYRTLNCSLRPAAHCT